MTDKNDYSGSIRTKGLDHTGFTEDLLRQAYATIGNHTLAIVDLKHVRQINDDATGRKVEFVIEAVYPSVDDDLNTHLRQLMKTLHQNKVLRADDAQLQIETTDDLEPTVEGVIAARRAHDAQTDDELPNPDEGDDPDGPSEFCSYPGCVEDDEHDGDHLDAAGDPVDDEPTEQPTDGKVVAFSNR